jgi:thiamine-phosphate pyrophosphorylase
MTANDFHIQVISRRLRPLDRTLPIVSAVLGAGVDSVQLRDEPEAMTAMIQVMRQDPAWNRDRLAVNGDPRVAGAYGIRWLHLGSGWLDQTPPFGKFARIGISVHSIEEAMEAEALGADYVTFGHVFSSLSHPGEPQRGVAALADVVTRLGIPVLAIGGIDHANVAEVLATGCAGLAVISAVVDHPDPGYAAQKLIETVEATGDRPKLVLQSLERPKKQGSSL